MEKKYYWLKLKRDFFKRHDIRIVESMPNGKDYILFYLKLLLESIDHNGNLRFSDTIPYNDEMLATITDTNIDIVRSAMKIFIELGFIEMLEDSTIFMTEVEKMIGTESKWAEKKRDYRQKLGQCPQNVLPMSEECPPNVRQEKEIEIDKEIDKESNKSKTVRFTPPSLEEVKEYLNERGSTISAEYFIDFYESNGWKVGKNKMKDWKATIRSWENREKSEAEKVDSFSRMY